MARFELFVAEVPSARRSESGTGSAWNVLIIATTLDSLNVAKSGYTKRGPRTHTDYYG